MNTSGSPLEGDEEPRIVTLGSGVERSAGALENPVVSKRDEDEDEQEEEEDNEDAPIISNLSIDDGRGISPKHDNGQEDAPTPTINTIPTKNAALTKSTDDEEDPVNPPPLSNPASDASKTIPQHRTTSSSGSASKKTTPPDKGAGRWYCCSLGSRPHAMPKTPRCNNCGHEKRGFYDPPKRRR